jgi:Mor family transcriptional regulator
MKYTMMDSLTLYELLDYMDTLDINDYVQEKYEAALVSESIRHEMMKVPYNSHPTDFTPRHIVELDEIIAGFIREKWKPKLKGLNCKVMVQSLYRLSDERCYYFPTTKGIRRDIKLYIQFGDKESINKLKLTNPELYNNMEKIGRREY